MERQAVYCKKMMRLALECADNVKGSTYPNPPVGTVIVDSEGIVATGATQPCGGDHAEVVALNKARHKAAGADMFVTLEPCAHYGRTPPCTAAIIQARPERVFIGMRDPNPVVNGAGIKALQKAGITVIEGVCADEAHRMLEEYAFYVRNGRPWITVKLAMTWDGRIADAEGASKWITNNQSRLQVHKIRCRHSAIAVGKGTLLKDDPRLTVRHCAGAQPVRIVFAESACAHNQLHMIRTASEIRTVFVEKGGEKGNKSVLENGVEVWATAADSHEAHIRTFLEMAYEESLVSILIEGGSRLAGQFFAQGNVNRVYFFYGNRIMGSGIPALSFASHTMKTTALKLDAPQFRVLEDNVMVTATLADPVAASDQT